MNKICFQPSLHTLAFIATLAIAMLSCASAVEETDLIITNAIIWTGNPAQPRAQAMAISADTITAIGSNAEISKYEGATTETVDAQGRFICPGFIDAHIHFIGGGFNLSSVLLREAKTRDDFIQSIADYAKTLAPGTWILGGDWDGSEWPTLPHMSWIDSVTRDHPVFVSRLDGHMALANSKALEIAGVDVSAGTIEGGEIVRDQDGALTGIFKDNAMGLISHAIPAPDGDQIDKALDAAMQYVASQGVTSVHNVWSSDPPTYAAAFERARGENRLITRVYDLGGLSDWKSVQEKVATSGPGDKWYKRDGLKGFVDGSLGSQTAAFYRPFLGSDNKGFFINSAEDLKEWITKGNAAGLQLAVHAIGDSAINVLLDIYEEIQRQANTRGQRFRIEHAQHIHKNDIGRFAELNIIASMQPYHAIDDGRWAHKFLDQERLNTTYAFKSLFDSGAMVVFGSDWPVAPASPIWGIYAAVTRRTLDDMNPEGWIPEQKITVGQALAAYTRNAAFASFEEEIKGTLDKGKLADFVILSEDITSIDPVRIKEILVLQTYVGGKKVYDRTGDH